MTLLRTKQESRRNTVWFAWMAILMAGLVASDACPGVKWKGGKQTVECRNRGLITLPSNIDPQTQVLDLSGSNLQTLPREAFMRANLLNLQKIYLASCRIGQVDATALRGLTNLIELDLSDNLLTDVPSAAFRDAPSLRELRLNNNPIQKIEQGAFDLAPGLVKLDLSDCQIEVLAAGAFDGLDQLSHLRLSGNRLEELRQDVVELLPNRLHGFELQGNPWICDCRLRYLREWIQKHNIPIPATASCVAPPRLAGKSIIELQVDDFACPPQVIPPPAAPLLGSGGHPHMHVEAAAGENATLTCRMSGVPSPEITWLWHGRPMTNGSMPGEPPEAPPNGGQQLGDDGFPPPVRTVLILEEGKYEKTSTLILSPAKETDSGEFVCVAANAAGLARANLTLRVDIQAPVVGGLGGAQIAGLGAGLFILLAAVVAILLLMLIRTRGSSGRGNGNAAGSKPTEENGKPMANGHSGVAGGQSGQIHSSSNGTTATMAKSPTLSALEYGQVAFVSPNSPNRVVVMATSSPNGAAAAATLGGRPDLIHDARTYSSDNYGYSSDYTTLMRRQQQQQQPRTGTMNMSHQSGDRDILAMGAAVGEYQSAQTDSFYPSALWDHVLNMAPGDMPPDVNVSDLVSNRSNNVVAAGNVTSPSIHLPHVPLASGTAGPPHIFSPYIGGQIIQNPRDLLPSYLDRERDHDSEGESAVSVDSYSYPRRIPQQQQDSNGQGFVPYPADYGLPRTQSPPCLPSPSSATTHLVAPSSAATELEVGSMAGAAIDQQQQQPPASGVLDTSPSIHQQQQQNASLHLSSSSCYGSKANSSAESSPASSATKSPRFWQQHRSPSTGAQQQQHSTTSSATASNNGFNKRSHHHFARDSPDEGYQEECATDV